MKQLKNFDLNEQATKNDVEDDRFIDDVMGKYKGKNEDELVSELLKAVSAAKEDGSFSVQSLKEFYELVSPHLGELQRNKLADLIRVISSEDIT